MAALEYKLLDQLLSLKTNNNRAILLIANLKIYKLYWSMILLNQRKDWFQRNCYHLYFNKKYGYR